MHIGYHLGNGNCPWGYLSFLSEWVKCHDKYSESILPSALSKDANNSTEKRWSFSFATNECNFSSLPRPELMKCCFGDCLNRSKRSLPSFPLCTGWLLSGRESRAGRKRITYQKRETALWIWRLNTSHMGSASEAFWFTGNGQIPLHSNFQSHLWVSGRLKAAMSRPGEIVCREGEIGALDGDKEG